jgi:hypothetical protein
MAENVNNGKPAMETRVHTIEQRLNGVEHSVEILSQDVRNLTQGFVTFQGDLKTFMATQNATKPMSVKDMIYMVIGVGTVVSMGAGLFFFIIDARVGAATARTTAFVDEVTKDGKLFVELHDLKTRVGNLELKSKP